MIVSRPDYLEQVSSIVEKAEPGSIFLASDFADIAGNKTAHMSLTGQKKLQRIMRGVYMKPRFSSLLGEFIPPAPRQHCKRHRRELRL